TLIAGESFTARAVPGNGYEFASYLVCSNGHEHCRRWHTTNPDLNTWFSTENGDEGNVTITVNPGLTKSLSNVSITASVRDESPTYKDFKAENKPDYSAVTMSIQVMDQLGIKRWCLVKVAEKTGTIDGSKYTYYEPLEYGEWQSFKRADNTYPAGQYETASVEIKEPGTYQIAFSDAETGNSRVYYPSGAFTVYEIKFEKGETDDNINTMSPIYKLANTEIILPSCTFTKTGYSFQNWSGTNTGISVDGAVFKANTNDTLTANWTNDQYTYKVEYYYMNADGTYSDTASDTATFTGKYGDVIVASSTGEGESAVTATEAIQKPKKNYTNDADPKGITGYQNSITLTKDNQTLKIYYKIGSYTITYKYTIPGEASETVDTKEYNFGATIEELDKPQKSGYDFVGWVYEGYGSVPDTMPAKNLTATGSFVAKSAKYNVVYHLETIGSGTTLTDKYEISADLTQIYNSKQGEQIKAYLSKGSDLTTNELAGIDIDGFTLKGVVVTYGAASNSGEGDIDNLPAKSITADSEKQYAEGTVNAAADQTLYINYYYTRNVYDLILEVWQDSREAKENKIYSESKQYQYGEEIQELVEKYKLDSYYVDENGSSKLTGFTMPTGYKFTSYTDFSTGNAPTVMPAGNVTVTRDVVKADKVKYYVEVYFEKSEIGKFDKMTTLTYEDTAGTNIKIVKNKSEKGEDENCTYLYYEDFVKTLNNYNYYTHIVQDSAEYKSVEAGKVVADETDPLVLRVYFERITTTATIKYVYGNGATDGLKNLTSEIKVSGKWGSSYTINPIALFDDQQSDLKSLYSNLGNNVVSESVTVNAISDKDGTTSDFQYNFRNKNYLVSFNGYYDYFNGEDVYSQRWPSYTFTTVSDNANSYEATSPQDAGLNNLITCQFGIKNAYTTIAYNQIGSNEEFYLDVRIKYSNLKDNTLGTWYTGAAAVEYDDNATCIPVTYDYKGNSYPLRVVNQCAIVNGVPADGEEEVENYPAANDKTRKYTYPDMDDLKKGFTLITGNYYYFDPSVSGASTAFGSKPCVFLANTYDSFIQGAYVGFGQGSGTYAYSQAENFLNAYKNAHGESTAEGAITDDNVSGLYLYNTSYGSTYLYGTHGYLTYTFLYHDKCRLYYMYNGTPCVSDDHLYGYGSTVKKNEISCEHLSSGIPQGYEMVWYLDGTFKNPIPDEGLTMSVDRTVYGRMEKSTIPNMEYIYYELADPITVGETTYRYVTQDNIDDIRRAGKTIVEKSVSKVVEIDNGLGGTVSKEYKITTYTYDGAVVMIAIERPTVSYTELYLTKDTEAYSDYYGKDYEGAYGKTGFYYDETNTANRSYGYVNTSPINLKVYFARDKYQVEVITNARDDSNPEIYTFSIGQKVQLGEPVKAGYTFAGWSWKKVTDEGLVDYIPSLEQGEQYFNMPGFNLQATANWTPAKFDQTVVHYFQTANQVYESGFISGISGTTSETQNVNFNDITGSADVYRDEDNAITAVVWTANNGDKYYFSSGTLNGENSLSLRETDLVAAETKIEVKSDESTGSDKGALKGLSMYSYAYTSYRSGTQVATLKDGDAYTPVYGMKLEYYYTRSANFKVRLAGVSTDGGETGLSFNGAGEHVYGESVNLVAVLAGGYDFLGWYKASDIFSDYPGDPAKENLSEYPVREDIATALGGLSPVSDQKTYNLSVNEDLDLVAVVKPEDTIAPTLEIRGNTEYTYGYEESAGNALMAIATKGEGADKTTVTGYQWYEITSVTDESGTETETAVLMEGQTSSTLLIETGKNAGTYKYRCVVSYKNSENRREGTIYKDAEITVKKANMTVSTKGYEGVFDNQGHSITLSVNKPETSYIAYYHEKTPLTKDNYRAIGKPNLPSYVHVNSNESGACAHTTYFYIEDLTGNYNDYIGSETVNITPKTISIKAKNATFSKLYDGNTEVVGAPTQEGTDMYNFAHGKGVYYELSGF
ncbi:MAG: InlB B-repeat-containing protein, partial [Lachnospiraceae bacterium]|nr:InlB B-repeat-containing protein [Lachnospiraceae bacterium]